MWRLKTVPPVAFNQERPNLTEGGLDVQGGYLPQIPHLDKRKTSLEPDAMRAKMRSGSGNLNRGISGIAA